MIRYLFVSLFCLLFALPLTADELTSTLGNPLTEVSHDVVVKIIDGHAAYTVTRVFINRGERPDEAMLQLDLPFGAAADGMRIKAGNRWYDAELLHADVAREKYNELTGLGRHKLKDPALLEWGWNDQLQLEVFPIITGKTSTVQYTLVAPTEYRDGRYTITYPRHNGDPDLAVPTITVRSDETVTLDGHPVSAGRPLVLAEDLRSSRCEELGYAAHCAVVSIPVADEGRFSELKLQVSLSHSYLSDLRGFLIAPDETTHALEVASDAWGKPIAIKFPEATVSGVWHLVIVDEVPLDRGTIRAVTLNGKNAIGSGEALPALIPDVPEEDTGTFALITVGKPHPNKTAVRYGRVVVPSQKKDSIARVELDVAAKLSQLPKRPRYIFVVDASHSAGETGVQSQIDIIAAMLHHVPDAEFEIVAYARKARRVLGSFKPVSALETLPAISTANGSNLDDAIQLAAKISREKTTRPTFALVMSDFRLRQNFDDARTLKEKLNATTHVVDFSAHYGAIGFDRDDTIRLGDLATRTGGIAVHASGFPIDKEKSDRRRARIEAEHLVRPVKVDHFELSGLDVTVPDVMFEGGSLRELTIDEQVASRVGFSGELWSKKIRWGSSSSRKQEKLAAAWVFTEGLWYDLTDEQQYALGMFARVVTPQTSFLAVEPGVRPSPYGIARGMLAGRGSGRGANIRSAAMRITPKLEWKKILGPVVSSCVRAHAPSPSRIVDLEIGVTGDEIVDVTTTSSDPYAQCLHDRTWNVRLKEVFPDQSQTVSVPTTW